MKTKITFNIIKNEIKEILHVPNVIQLKRPIHFVIYLSLGLAIYSIIEHGFYNDISIPAIYFTLFSIVFSISYRLYKEKDRLGYKTEKKNYNTENFLETINSDITVKEDLKKDIIQIIDMMVVPYNPTFYEDNEEGILLISPSGRSGAMYETFVELSNKYGGDPEYIIALAFIVIGICDRFLLQNYIKEGDLAVSFKFFDRYSSSGYDQTDYHLIDFRYNNPFTKIPYILYHSQFKNDGIQYYIDYFKSETTYQDLEEIYSKDVYNNLSTIPFNQLLVFETLRGMCDYIRFCLFCIRRKLNDLGLQNLGYEDTGLNPHQLIIDKQKRNAINNMINHTNEIHLYLKNNILQL